MRTARRATGSRVVAALVLIWLIIGVLAAWQRGYLSSNATNCAGLTTSVVTIAAGPLNYLGVNPQVQCPQLPQPSK
jgi:hypothetical protein